ncbi:small multi-drug export protein [Lederbergia citrea]|uniref:Small multi-drug export protein n=1 Tax=Lederbergia citrea TaxID=2833581 RepID=A0A942UPW5_9BACI|nr:small multi-drug export protein [Lederbergia citrea]MBS4176089.1 small multi-drug export protein [Lederbergia citrea]MBS4202650.1 small multi-drug export protein [Lederbergia citrea]MBS4222683.1 small multi-drug export protein [Lederbergia citrea]
MATLWEYIVVFLLAATPWFEMAAVIPLGIVRGLQPLLVVILAFIGNLSTIILVVYLFEKIQAYLVKKKGIMKEDNKRQRRAKKIWNKYGLPGLAIIGPLLIGTHISAFLGMSLGATKNWTLLWMTISLVLWSVVFGVGAYYGIETFKTMMG